MLEAQEVTLTQIHMIYLCLMTDIIKYLNLLQIMFLLKLKKDFKLNSESPLLCFISCLYQGNEPENGIFKVTNLNSV